MDYQDYLGLLRQDGIDPVEFAAFLLEQVAELSEVTPEFREEMRRLAESSPQQILRRELEQAITDMGGPFHRPQGDKPTDEEMAEAIAEYHKKY